MTSCPSKRRCRHCGGRHHTLLHAQPADSTSSASTEDSVSTQLVAQTRPVTPASGTSTESILQLTGRSQRSLYETAMVVVSSGEHTTTARAQLDTGTGISLMTSRLVKRLKPKRIQSSMALDVLDHVTMSKSAAEVTLSSTHSSQKESKKVFSQIIDGKLPLSTPNLTPYRSLPFL